MKTSTSESEASALSNDDVATPEKKAKKVPSKRRARARKPATADRGNKKAAVIAMLKRGSGATLAAIMEATGWQAHTVRGFISVLGSKGGQKIESAKNARGERTYHRVGK